LTSDLALRYLAFTPTGMRPKTNREAIFSTASFASGGRFLDRGTFPTELGLEYRLGHGQLRVGQRRIGQDGFHCHVNWKKRASVCTTGALGTQAGFAGRPGKVRAVVRRAPATAVAIV